MQMLNKISLFLAESPIWIFIRNELANIAMQHKTMANTISLHWLILFEKLQKFIRWPYLSGPTTEISHVMHRKKILSSNF